jgi:hypothetical protein
MVRLKRAGWGLAAIAAALCVAGTAQAGEWRAPRTAWGAPDLGGLWSNSSLTHLERDDPFKALVPTEAEAKAFEAKHRGKPPEMPEDTVGGAASEFWETDVGLARIRGQVRSSWIISPADGKLPFSAAAKAARKARHERRKVDFDGPEARSLDERCMDTSSAGPPLTNGGYNDNFQIVQTPGAVAIHAEYMHDVRVVRLEPGAKHPPPGIRRWLGDSIGHWEGPTLVVESTNFMPPEYGGKPGDLSSDQTVVERFTRTGPDEIFYAFRVTSPSEYVQTWSGEMVLRATKGPIYEFACHEGNYALENMLLGARHGKAGGGTAPATPTTATTARAAAK